ncbi:MAG TPA: choice-of-anchor V domain-containing protein [Candidatus Thalassarchaeaceae archaeon]|nr:choice-of-anchor V domain-containing protein [Candidatus Thalassarchaeaceae archaeon]
MIIIVLCLLLIVGPAAIGESNGISGVGVDNGCVCHGGGTQDAEVSVSLTGLPDGEFSPGSTYPLTLTITGGPNSTGTNNGGFNLRATGGILSPSDGLTQIENGELTHTTIGNDQRSWTFDWVAPQFGSVTFTGYGNSVNGDGAPDTTDLWNVVSETATGPPPKGDPVGFTSDTGEPMNTMPYVGVGLVATLVIIVLQRKSDAL